MKFDVFVPALLVFLFAGFTDADNLVLETMLNKVEETTLLFAKKVEELIFNKCDYISDETCYGKNYEPCFSELKNATCPGNDYNIPKCGSGNAGGCGGLFDFTTSTTSVAPDPSDPFSLQEESDRVKDAICSTLPIENYMKEVTQASIPFWEKFGLLPPSLYYGTDDGVFRKFPGSPGKCPNKMNDYDPRLQPWYVAASSGPKDVILVLDTSNSMADFDRLNIMQKAAKRVVNSLGVTDYFAIIEFNNNATVVGDDNLMVRATDENKEKMLNYIDSFEVNGGTNYYNAFNLTFQTLKSSALQDRSSHCQKALLFLSDGKMSESDESENALFELIRAEKQSNLILFTYSFGGSKIGSVPGRIACEFDGIWAQINDYGDLAKSMGAYYKFFAYGLSDSVNDEFIAWVEPYGFSSGFGMGTTASRGVWDRSTDPPTFAGVVGIDISFIALQKSFGGIYYESKDAMQAKIVNRAEGICPVLKITDCQLESLRKYGSNEEGDDNALCSKCNSVIKPLKSPLCNNYPDELWSNRLNRGRTFVERACCKVGSEPRIENTLTDREIKNGICSEGISVGSVLPMIISAIVVVAILSLGSYLFRRWQQYKY